MEKELAPANESQNEESDAVDSEPDEAIAFKYSITSYGADYPVDSLVKRMRAGDITIPRFQRGYVWSLREASRFIESLLLGLPVPGIFLSKEKDTNKLLVIDGQQRLRTIQYYYHGVFEPSKRQFALCDIGSEFNNITYSHLSDEDRRRLDDAILHATIVKQDEPSDDDSSIYQIFERLNTGGRTLKPQEIRACIYHGKFCELLKELNSTSSWRKIYGIEDKSLRDVEMILRFLALFLNRDNYGKPMKEFLNKFMGGNRDLQKYAAEPLRNAFVPTIDVIFNALGRKAFKPERGIRTAVFDAVMFAIAQRLKDQRMPDCGSVRAKYYDLLQNTEFIELTKSGTTDTENVNGRINIAISAFRDI